MNKIYSNFQRPFLFLGLFIFVAQSFSPSLIAMKSCEPKNQQKPTRPRPRATADELIQMRRLRSQGYSVQQIVKLVGFSYTTVQRVLKDENRTVYDRLSPEEREHRNSIIPLYEQGKTQKQIGKILGLSTKIVDNHLKRRVPILQARSVKSQRERVIAATPTAGKTLASLRRQSALALQSFSESSDEESSEIEKVTPGHGGKTPAMVANYVNTLRMQLTTNLSQNLEPKNGVLDISFSSNESSELEEGNASADLDDDYSGPENDESDSSLSSRKSSELEEDDDYSAYKDHKLIKEM
jgi:transposase